MKDPSDGASLLSQALRSQIEDEAVEFAAYAARLGSTRLVGPAYAIIGGPRAGQGLVLTITPNSTVPLDTWAIPDEDALPASAPQGEKYYVLETNYDHWEDPPKIDDRRSSAYDCMDNVVGADGVSKDSIYSVLAAMPQPQPPGKSYA